jgi:hypothetical protein
VLKRIGELVEAGATMVGSKPARSNSLRGYPDCDREVRDLAARIWGDCDGGNVKTHAYGKGKVIWNLPLNEVLSDMGVERDFVPENINNEDQHIDYIHRATAAEDIYFVSNSAMTREVVRCRFRIGAGRIPSFWNAEDGIVRPCHAYEIKDGFTHLTLDLAPASSVFVVFATGGPRDSIVEIQEPAGSKDRPSLEVVALDGDTVSVKVWQAGTYQFKTAGGRSGTMVVADVPAEQPIKGPWRIAFPKDRGAPPTITMENLTDWTKRPDPGVKYFSGAATYHKQFVITEKNADGKSPLILDLGSVKDLAVVRVNGQEVGELWKEPYRIDIAPFVKVGENEMEITVVNTWNNRIIGDLCGKPEERVTRTNLTDKFRADSPLLPSGLLGPVLLRSPVFATCNLR